MNISRQRAFLTGMNGGYLTDPVKGMNEMGDTNGFNGSIDSSYVGNYNTSFKGGMNGNVILNQPDYKNQTNTLHNNIGEKVIQEQYLDNKLFIDAYFRDFSKSPDIFSFIIKFNGKEAVIENVSVYIDNETYSYPKYIEGDTNVVIDRTFKNIKSVTINTLIMPNYIEYITQEDGSYKNNNVRLIKTSYRYILLKIKELSNERCFSNNKAFGKESFMMRIDDELCYCNHRLVPISNNNVSYNDSQLKTIDRLTVEICDDRGIILCPTLDGNNHDFFEEYRKTIGKILHLQSINSQYSKAEIEKLLPKLKSLKDITEHIAPELHLTFSTLEPQINTLPQYRY